MSKPPAQACYTLKNTIQSAWNTLWFSWRSLFKWSRKPYQETFEPKINLYHGRVIQEQLEQRERLLVDRYALQLFKATSSRNRYLETLTYLDFLEALWPNALTLPNMQPLSWLDVGAKNWSYVESLYCFAHRLQPNVALHGIEVDGYRRYTNFYHRLDYAQTYIQDCPNASYEVGDILHHQDQYSIITCFLPFVFMEPCLQWGLPLKHFQPEAFLRHLISLLLPHGVLLITNQGAEEFEAQKKLFSQVNAAQTLDITPVGILSESFLPYKIPRYGWQCIKK